MIVLGIDTSGYTNAVGIVDGDSVLADHAYEARTDSLQQIVANIDAALKDAGLALGDVEGIGVGLGPGSWTGIRVGVTVGKMLAFTSGKPVCGVPTLEVLAYKVRNESHICSMIKVGAGDTVYAACYNTENGSLDRIGDYYVGDVKGLTGLLTGDTVLVGKGVKEYARVIREGSGLELKVVETLPGGGAVACLAARRFIRGEKDDVLSLTPLYLKESTAKAFVNKYKRGHK
ncbi:MAG: tRNA (adenosine(37)-N6)-threonylcarbamoyltransferase complex dimerization subunit type 1 TsaB [Dehalococcoidales bacterium]|nr:tRNA (adenosine(37)-N6)-threonylcarbamoyltransferase complex dimerization subunit type 1 TsaB [Dehalococcoidales bacterium]